MATVEDSPAMAETAAASIPMAETIAVLMELATALEAIRP